MIVFVILLRCLLFIGLMSGLRMAIDAAHAASPLLGVAVCLLIIGVCFLYARIVDRHATIEERQRAPRRGRPD